MRNLKTIALSSEIVSNISVNDIYVDKLSGALWAATDKGIARFCHQRTFSALLTNECVLKIVYLHLPCICIQCISSVVLLQIPDQILERLDFEGPLQCCVFSPDLSVGVVLTDDNHVIVVNASLERVVTINLSTLATKWDGFVNVGWGKAETQFRGTLKMPEKTDEISTLSSSLPGEISWREDGNYFAVLWTDKSGPRFHRRLHIFNINGELFSVGAETHEMETGLCWRPRVQLIATSKRRVGRFLHVAFSELNGLSHGEVPLLSSPHCDRFRVGKIIFDTEEHIMAVLLLPLDTSELTVFPFVKLYTSSNYHWSVKAELSLIPHPHPPTAYPLGRVSLTFGNVGEASTSTLHAAVSVGPDYCDTSFLSWSFVSCIDRNAWLADTEDPAIVAVIDGQNVGITAFAYTTIPPPMHASRLTFPVAVSSVSLSPSRTTETGVSVSLFVQFADSAAPPWFLALASDWREPRHPVSAGLNILQERQQAAPNHAPCITDAWTLRKKEVIFGDATASSIFYHQLLHIVWISPEKLCFVSHNGRHIGMLSKVTTNDFVSFKILCLASLPAAASFPIIGLVYGPKGKITVQVGNGGIHVVDLKSLEEAAESEANAVFEFPEVASGLPFACDQFHIVTFCCKGDTSLQTHLFVGLQSSSHRLCALPWKSSASFNIGECVMHSCSSLAVHSDFLLVTNLENHLLIVPLVLAPNEFHSLVPSLKKRLANDTKGEGGSNAYSRLLESGARIMVAVARTSKIVLQMPRGNLEDIHPRALVFGHLAPVFDSMHHAKAIEMMRRHRINLNLLFDYNPRKFLANITNFVHQVASPEYITLFVSDLHFRPNNKVPRGCSQMGDTSASAKKKYDFSFFFVHSEDDITKTEYNGFFGVNQVPVKSVLANVPKSDNELRDSGLNRREFATKVNIICNALLKVMLPESKKFILPILTCYWKKQPPEVEKGLITLKGFKDRGDVDVWERGLRHLQYCLSPVKLFRVALGTYDLALAEAMAKRTQMDPKEYRPCLSQLQALGVQTTGDGDSDNASNIIYQHARIDILLQRYSKALKGLHSAGEAHWKEFCELAETQKLFSEALSLLEPGTSHFSEISRLWARHLVASQRLVTAGEVHLRAGHFASAAGLFLATNSTRHWRLAVARSALSTSTRPDGEEEELLSPEEIRRQALRLAQNLQSLGRFEEAMLIYAENLQDYKSAVCVAIEGNFWLEAHRLAEYMTDKKSVTTLFKRRVLQFYEDTIIRLTDETEEFYKTLKRLFEIRVEMREKSLKVAGGDEDEISDDTSSQLYSDTGSVVSSDSAGSHSNSLSTNSGRTRKTRRKQERKKWSTKRGSKFEEVGLIQMLHSKIASGQRLFETLPALTDELWRLGESAAARNLIRRANSLLHDHHSALNIIWCHEITGAAKPGEVHEMNSSKPTKRYPFHEPFLLFPPDMTIRRIDYDFL